MALQQANSRWDVIGAGVGLAYAALAGGVTQFLTHATLTLWGFNVLPGQGFQVVADNVGMVTNTYTFTVPSDGAGVWSFSTWYFLSNAQAFENLRSFWGAIYVNDVIQVWDQVRWQHHRNPHTRGMNLYLEKLLAAGDTIQMYVWSDIGGGSASPDGAMSAIRYATS